MPVGLSLEKLVLLFYNSWDSRAGLTRLVVLGIGSQQYLSCREKAGRPQLELEVSVPEGGRQAGREPVSQG